MIEGFTLKRLLNKLSSFITVCLNEYKKIYYDSHHKNSNDAIWNSLLIITLDILDYSNY